MHQEKNHQRIAQERLQELPTLSRVLGDNWIAQEHRKPIDQRSLIAGWLSTEWTSPIEPFELWVEDLDSALCLLETSASDDVWRKICGKVRTHCDRSNSKGTLSEIAICVLLAHHSIPFELETGLTTDSSKDVDITTCLGGGKPLHIEVQWLSPSDKSERGAAVASAYGECYRYRYDYESYRIKRKIHEKTSKLTKWDVTFIALNCTLCPELGGDRPRCSIKVAALEAFTGQDIQGNPLPYANSDIDTTIRSLVDGVLWFELNPGDELLPTERGVCLNPCSPNVREESVTRFTGIWKPSGAG